MKKSDRWRRVIEKDRGGTQRRFILQRVPSLWSVDDERCTNKCDSVRQGIEIRGRLTLLRIQIQRSTLDDLPGVGE